MSLELNLVFSNPQQVTVQSRTGITKPLNFHNPITNADLQDIRWYLETYSTFYTADVDDQRARRIEQKLPEWGTALFTATLVQFSAQSAFSQFYANKQPGRVLTIGASHPDILALPWELLHIPDGNFLFHSNPRISIRRQFNVTGGFNLVEFQPKAAVRILFVISRPDENAGFIDPRSDAKAVLDALDAEGKGKVEVEFLRPATVDALIRRLEDRRQPTIDIIHFDGHGVYDPDGRFFEEAKHSNGLSLTRDTPAEAADMGYLLFEDEQGKPALISAETLAAMLNEQTVGLVVLSACQSAMVGVAADNSDDENSSDNTENEKPESGVMGSVAARLTHAGVPAVLAMTHSVLVTTTRELFAEFYKNLVRGYGMGEALDNARRYLYLHPERGTRLRGQQQEVTLRLQDWFLPALYQTGSDTSLLTEASPVPPAPEPLWGNLLDVQEAGFWGRSRELWQIERAFVQGTRRLTITGFGGQGKTYLVQEVGRWLYRTGMFKRVCFVDYASYQGQDPVSYAVSTLSTVLDRSFPNADAVTRYLHLGDPAMRTPPPAVLIILDNLEALEPEPQRALLTAAKLWSEAGTSRLLLTTRQPDFHHLDYKIAESRQHIRLPLKGLGSENYPNEALDYFESLWALPPESTTPKPDRSALVKLFQMVDFHPLSIGLLARQLKTRRIVDVGMRLAELLADAITTGSSDGEIGNPLIASLNLSLDRLDETARQLIPRLGIFRGGALEIQILQILELSESDWYPIRERLESTGLIWAEYLPGVKPPYLKFHPNLSPVLWSQLTREEQTALQAGYTKNYHQLSSFLYQQDRKNPDMARAIAHRELPNLMQAVQQVLATTNTYDSVDFVNNVKVFLQAFGLRQDTALLLRKLEKIQVVEEADEWLLTLDLQGEMLIESGHVDDAFKLYKYMQRRLGNTPSLKLCATLRRLGKCLYAQGKLAHSARYYRASIMMTEQLEQNSKVQCLRGFLHADLGNILRDMGDHTGAKLACDEALKVAESQEDLKQIGVIEASLAKLALGQNHFQEALPHLQKARAISQRLGDKANEAGALHELGIFYQKVRQWREAEQCYREAAQIFTEQGDLNHTAGTWIQLALLNERIGQIESAINWCQKALDVFRKLDQPTKLSSTLHNYAMLLESQPQPSSDDLATAHKCAEEALEIRESLDPLSPEIWKSYEVLAQIADKQGKIDEGRIYRHQVQEAKASSRDNPHPQRVAARGLIIASVAVAASGDIQMRERLPLLLEEMAQRGQIDLVAVIQRIINGERDEVALCRSLDHRDSMLVHDILQGIADPITLKATPIILKPFES